jgi:phage tail protein X
MNPFDSPIVQGGPDFLPQVHGKFIADATWIALGQTPPQRIYISTQGDWWDMIAMRVYGLKRGNEHLMYRLLEANYPIAEIANFPAGIPVIVPTVAVKTEIPLVPWTSATIGP